MRKRLIQDIVAARQIRERSERYLPLVNKVYEVLYAKYGVKPLSQRCEFSPAEVEEFIREVMKARRPSGPRRGGSTLSAVVADPDASMMDVEQRTPSQLFMCTPRQSPVSEWGSAMHVGSVCGNSSMSRGVEGSSLFRARVQSEMRAGGGGGGGSSASPSQFTTPTGSVCSRPSPLLSDKRASQLLPLQCAIPASGHINPCSSKIMQPSSQWTPTTDSYNTNPLRSAPHKPIQNCRTGSLMVDRQLATPMSARPTANLGTRGSVTLGAASRENLCDSGPLSSVVGKHVHVGLRDSDKIRGRASAASPGIITPLSSNRSGHMSSGPNPRQEACANSVPRRVLPYNPGSVRQLPHYPGSEFSSASVSSVPPSTSPTASCRQRVSLPTASQAPDRFGPSKLLSVPQVQSNSAQRKPLSGRYV